MRQRSNLVTGALLGVYLVAAAVGYVAGDRDLLRLGRTRSSSPLARVGFVLQQEIPQGNPQAWDELRTDVAHVRSTLKPDERGVFNLVVALRGLENGGDTEWSKAAKLCHELQWPRCDRSALEELKKRSRP